MHLVEVDDLDAERLEAAVDRGLDVLGAGLPPDAERRLGLPGHPGLGRHDHLVAALAYRAADDALGPVLAVDVRGVDPVDAGVERGVASGERLLVLRAAPAPAQAPGPEADHRQLEVGAAEPPALHQRGVSATSSPPSSS